jgi:hypothetical protein
MEVGRRSQPKKLCAHDDGHDAVAEPNVEEADAETDSPAAAQDDAERHRDVIPLHQ